MAQATTSLPHSPIRRHAREVTRTVPIEERVSVLETRWEMLATKADVRGAENRMILWILGAGIALAGFFFAILSANTARIDKLDTKLESSIGKLDAKLEASIGRLDTRIDKLDARIDKLDARIDKLDEKIDSRFDALMAELRSQRKSGE